MAKKESANPVGRPVIELDWDQFKKICALQPTLEEVATFFECSSDTIERRCFEKFGENFAEVYKRFSVGGKLSLRRNQMKLSEKNATMAIWLGKQWLGQDDPDAKKIANSTRALADTLIKYGVVNTSKDIVRDENMRSDDTDYIGETMNVCV